MTAPVSRCPEHGYVAGDACPACDAPVDRVLGGARREQLSKFVSGALRHFPDDAGVALDDAGWTAFDDLAAAVADRYDWATQEHLAAVVATDPKGRFERADGRVRAAYGHSVAVDLDAPDASGTDDDPAPDTLYHGTPSRNLASIEEEGLRPMSRQQVHLSGTVAEARAVGERHGENPVVFAVDAAAMQRDGHRVVERGASTYTTDAVPPKYLSRDG